MSKKSIMELQDFVYQTLVAIIGGVGQVQEFATENNVIVYPAMEMPFSHPLLQLTKDDRAEELRIVSIVEFDVSVGAITTGKGELGIGVAQLGLGVGSKVSAESSQQSRVRFAIPVAFPPQAERTDTAKRR